MGFAEKLVMFRKEFNMTQESLAERCNVTRQAIAKWEKGESLPDVYLIARLASMFGVSIEEMIWSRDTATLENKKFYIREAEDRDKQDFCILMREHRFLGKFLQLLDNEKRNTEVDDVYWNEYRGTGKIYVLRTKSKEIFGGYIYVESIESNAPQLTMQFSKQGGFDETDFTLIHDLFNWISKEYQTRAIQVFLNSAIERELFTYLGYRDVADEVMLSLPI